MIDPSARPRLAPKARLKADSKSGRTLLLYPEAGLQLNATSAEVLRRCDGARTVGAIVSELCTAYAPTPPDTVAREIDELLQRLVDRGLVRLEP